jgi:hypothetical protein
VARPPRGNRKLIRAINRSAVLNTVKTEGPVSRTEVAQVTGLSAATVSGITADLIDSGLIFEKEAGDSSGGRRPILLALNPRGGFVIGLKLTETNITAALTDLEATVIAKDTCPLEDHSVKAVVDLIAKTVRTLLAGMMYPSKQPSRNAWMSLYTWTMMSTRSPSPSSGSAQGRA